jgi:alpha-tubulin suppressor-like RCC1 family protein
MEGATAIAGTECDFSCAVLPDASVWCWGALPGSTDGDGSSASPVMVPGVSATAHGIAAGFGHACAVSPSGAVQCWGSNTHGELGDGTTFASFTPVSVRGLAGAAIAVTAGSVHSCALLADSTVQCWGDNTWGQLGSGDFEPSRLPVAVSGLVDAVAVSAGVSHTCALTRAGGVRCWGNNDVGQLGAGDMNGSHVASPVAVLGF